ncbi:hypothetical protein [Pedobacter sp. R-06]|uniref:hypothetical protein n=1 Tax=Pedobacter sp. R-06 TaxID=3404051 RepID=UPI003CE76061
MTKTFKVTRVYTDAEGESNFQDVEYPLLDAGYIGFLSDRFQVKEMIFRTVRADYNDYHQAPERQFVVLLDLGVEIETSLGEKRQFQPGEILLMEDTTGKGHRSQNLEYKTRNSLFIILK